MAFLERSNHSAMLQLPSIIIKDAFSLHAPSTDTFSSYIGFSNKSNTIILSFKLLVLSNSTYSPSSLNLSLPYVFKNILCFICLPLESSFSYSTSTTISILFTNICFMFALINVTPQLLIVVQYLFCCFLITASTASFILSWLLPGIIIKFFVISEYWMFL